MSSRGLDYDYRDFYIEPQDNKGLIYKSVCRKCGGLGWYEQYHGNQLGQIVKSEKVSCICESGFKYGSID